MSTEQVFSVSTESITELDYLRIYELMQMAAAMTTIYEQNRTICKYVHATSRGHEAIQLAIGLQLQNCDCVSPYYRDDAMLLGMGFTPYQVMLQLLAKADDPFSGGRTYYSHPANNRPEYPLIPHQSSATGMQAIPATGMAQAIQYKEEQGLLPVDAPRAIVVCSLGDGSVTEGEVSEAMQFAALKQLPIIFLVQDNDWGISVSSQEARSMTAYEYAAGFKGMERMTIDGSDIESAWQGAQNAIEYVRQTRQPILLHAKVPLLNHHTSGVRMEWYRSDEDLAQHRSNDPLPKLHQLLLSKGFEADVLQQIEQKASNFVAESFQKAVAAPDPAIESLTENEFAPTPIVTEKGNRTPKGKSKVVMVDAALLAMDEILRTYPEAVFYGQDVGRRLGGVFREAATLAEKYGDRRVFNTAIQEAYLVGSTIGMSALGLKPIVEIQFADYFWTGINQLVCELSKSCYLSRGQFPVQALIRVPIGAYGGGGPYHSGCIESSLLPIRGIKIVFPSNAADMKGLLKAAFLDPNPVVMLEHKGLYWSKVAGTEEAKTVEPDEDYIIPLGKANIVQHANEEQLKIGNSLVVITYGMGIYWAKTASQKFKGSIEIVDLRTLSPLDEECIYAAVKRHNKVIVLTEESVQNSFAQTIAARISHQCFRYLDAPVEVIGAIPLPAVPLNMDLERAMLPNAEKVAAVMQRLLND